MAAAVIGRQRKIYANSDTDMMPDIMAKADATRTFFDDAALDQRPQLTEQDERAELSISYMSI